MKRRGVVAGRVRGPREIGWREYVGLPDLGVPSMRAKIDTGARTSALHAANIERFERDGCDWVRFSPLTGRKSEMRCEAQLVHHRHIKNTGGSSEERPIIETTLVLGRYRWPIEVSLTNRDNMEFDLIVGRTAVRRYRMVVNPGRSYIAGLPLGPAVAAASA
ncbi:MAG TPA: RimK/LysX family protein [Methyloceanibacter sp.]|nr:RimK/LysX family protein [Methyloceanibacter sp.]